jgi:hypothetical protein
MAMRENGMLSPVLFGRVTVAALLAFSVVQAETTLVPRGADSTWHYLDSETAPGAKWAAPDFADAAWPAGPAPLGYGEDKLGTILKDGAQAARKPLTAWFRRTFEIKEVADVASLGVFLNCDDGGLVLLNGEEVGRWNLPVGAITPATRAENALSDDEEGEYHRFVVPAKGHLRAGVNTLAVEVHQASATSSDLFFDLEVKAWKAGEAPKVDFYKDGLAALQAREWAKAVELLGQTPPEHPDYVETMLRVGTVYTRMLKDPVKALPFMDRAYERLPGNMEIAYSWVRAHVAARQGLAERLTARPLPKEIPAAWRFITDGPKWPDLSMPLPRKKLLEDLDYLEDMIANCYAYADRRGADWRGALDALRASLPEQVGLDTFLWRLTRFMTVFGDPHSAFRAGVRSEPRGRIPVVFADHGGKVLAVKADRSDFLDAACPVVTAIDDIPLEKWLIAANNGTPQASPQFTRHMVLRSLSSIESLGWEVGRKSAPECKLTLASLDGKKTGEAKVAIAPPRRGEGEDEPAGGSRKMGEIGYLRIPQMDSSKAFIDGLDARMAEFRDTQGLIVDERGNGGGTQDAIKTLLPYFMKADDPLKIINIAAYRLPLALPKPNPEGFLGLGGRGLHPATSKVWSEAERTAINGFLKDWKPKWALPAGKFSDWHVMAITPKSNPKATPYPNPVVVLLDEGCFSATDNFLGALKGQRNVTLLGTTSGGGSGRMAEYQLPNTKIPLTLCQMASFATTGMTYDGNGVLPDIKVETGLEDVLRNKTDAQLAAALERLKKKQGGGN